MNHYIFANITYIPRTKHSTQLLSTVAAIHFLYGEAVTTPLYNITPTK